jgi:hypothetical protein
MITLRLLKAYRNKRTGDLLVTTNNIAHALIENGVAEKATSKKAFLKPPKDKMVRSSPKVK